MEVMYVASLGDQAITSVCVRLRHEFDSNQASIQDIAVIYPLPKPEAGMQMVWFVPIDVPDQPLMLPQQYSLLFQRCCNVTSWLRHEDRLASLNLPPSAV